MHALIFRNCILGPQFKSLGQLAHRVRETFFFCLLGCGNCRKRLAVCFLQLLWSGQLLRPTQLFCWRRQQTTHTEIHFRLIQKFYKLCSVYKLC